MNTSGNPWQGPRDNGCKVTSFTLSFETWFYNYDDAIAHCDYYGGIVESWDADRGIRDATFCHVPMDKVAYSDPEGTIYVVEKGKKDS